jgi:hypothetical protein
MVMLIAGYADKCLVSPLSCDLKLINGKSLNKSKTKTNIKWIKSEPVIWTLAFS